MEEAGIEAVAYVRTFHKPHLCSIFCCQVVRTLSVRYLTKFLTFLNVDTFYCGVKFLSGLWCLGLWMFVSVLCI